jgi:RNA polymerase sigma-70 factor, ECF subfamily
MGVSEDARLEAIELLYRDRYPDFVRTASAITASREAGRDAVHDAFVAAIRKRSDYRGDGTLEAWVWPMVIRNALKRRGLGRREPPTAEISDPSRSDVVWIDRPDDGPPGLRAAVEALPERQRLILFLRYYGDLDYRTIAKVAAVQIGTVGAELHAAHRSLRRHLKEVPSRD